MYLWGGAGATDPVDVLSRNGFGTSAAMTDAVQRALSRASVDTAALDIVDAYSCFPVVPKLLTRTLGRGDLVPSVTGGHSFFGGPLDSYTLHSIAEVTRRLREDGGTALVHGNGGYLTYQHVVLLAGAPATGFVVAHTPDGRRLAGHTGAEVAAALSAFAQTPARSAIGRSVHVTDRDGVLSLRF